MKGNFLIKKILNPARNLPFPWVMTNGLCNIVVF